MKSFLLLLTFAVTFAASAAAQPRAFRCDASDLVITDVDVWTGTDWARDQDVRFSGGRVTALAPRGTVRPERGVRQIRGRGAYLLPGFIDSHVHLLDLPSPNPPGYDGAPNPRAFAVTAKATLRSGVTTARVHLMDVATAPIAAAQGSDDCAPVPRVHLGGPGLVGGSPQMNAPSFTGFIDLADARAKIAARAAAGVGWIALHSIDRFDPAELLQVAADIRRLRLRILAEGQRAPQISLALDIGADSIDYLVTDEGNAYSAEDLARIVRTQTFIAAPIGFARLSIAARENPEAFLADPRLYEFMDAPTAAAVRAAQLERLRATPAYRGADRADAAFMALVQAGAPLVVASDSGSTGNFQVMAVWTELKAWTELGVGPAETLTGVTSRPAALLAAPDVGVLRPGARADFVLYDGRIEEGVFDLNHVVAVAKGGVLYVENRQWVGP